MKLEWASECASLEHPLQKERLRALKTLGTWLEQQPAEDRSFENLKELFTACCTALYLTDGLKPQRKVTVEIAKLTRSDTERPTRVAALLMALEGFWAEIDCHRVPKFLLLVRVIVAEILYQVLAADLDEAVTRRVYSALVLVNPVCNIPEGGEYAWLSKKSFKGFSVSPAIWLQMIAVWFEELAKQTGGLIYIRENKNERPQELDSAIRVLSCGEFAMLCSPLVKSIATYGSGENVWRRVAEALGALEESEEIFGDAESRRLAFYFFGRVLEAVVAGGLVTARNTALVNELRMRVHSISGYEGEFVETDREAAKDWSSTYDLIVLQSS